MKWIKLRLKLIVQPHNVCKKITLTGFFFNFYHNQIQTVRKRSKSMSVLIFHMHICTCTLVPTYRLCIGIHSDDTKYTWTWYYVWLSKKFIEEIRKCRVLWTLCTFLFKEHVHGGNFLLLCCIALLLLNRLPFYITNAFDYVRFLLSIFILEGISASVISRKKYFSHCTFSYRWLTK